ncbi:MAG: hypothetical protein U0234_22930 [Sandaracinus sp.]
MPWTRPPFDPARPFGDRYPTLNSWPEPIALTLTLPWPSPWWRYPGALARDIPGARPGACIVRIDDSRGWEPGNVRVDHVPPDLARQREDERSSFIGSLTRYEQPLARAPRGPRSSEWRLKVLAKRMRGFPGRPVKGYSAFLMWKRLDDWAIDVAISESTLRRGLKAGRRLEDIILEVWNRRGYA